MDTSLARARTVALVSLSGAALAGLAGCGGTAEPVPAEQVGSTIVTQLKSQGVTIDADAVSCPGGLAPEVGQSIRCTFTANGQPVEAVAKVSSVDGSTVNLDVATEAKPVAKAVLEKAVTDQLTRNGVPSETTTCAGDLAPQVGQTQTCTATGGGGDILLTTTVTEVRGGLVNFSIADG